ncbi:Phospholipid methyltransferase [Penicillium malachiteum]|uniref:Phospholipid methyltransferase n=1 Tax=Penicillium malachiteum TaxID=1324776 RepID=A0AAD6HEC4_9EURO|nr:Phospholipid methyltransferase [Penicillium malachiteum]
MSDLSILGLAAAMVLAGYLFDICATPPNPSPPKQDRPITDRIAILIGSRSHPAWVGHIATAFILYHAFITALPVIAPESMSQVCPNAENRNKALFQWSASTTIGLGLIYVGTFIRIMAYGGLGRSFTFHLAPPDRLITSGIYKWIQHPSYSGLLFVLAGAHIIFGRWDGGPACWLSESLLSKLHGFGIHATALISIIGTLIITTRIRDEQSMLKDKFGEEWEEWHAMTSRIIPGVF